MADVIIDPVTAVVAHRAQGTERLGPFGGWSLVAHVALTAIVAVAPVTWMGRPPQPELALQVSLDGLPGARDGVLAVPDGGPSRQERSSETLAKPPTPRAPEMTEAERRAPAPSATGSNEVAAGSLIPGPTVNRGQGFGQLSGIGTGAYLDVANFCCPEYLATMLDLINRNWNSRQGAVGSTLVSFVIERDGRIATVAIERSSGVAALDYFSQRSLALTGQLPPLPAAFTGDRLTVHLGMDYVR